MSEKDSNNDGEQMAIVFTAADPAFLLPQKGNPNGDPPATAKAAGVIGNMTYTATQAGAAGNSITVSHILVSPVAATFATATLGGLTYTATSAGSSGNSISVSSTAGSAGVAGTATLTRALSPSGTATFSITENSGYFSSPTTVKLTAGGFLTSVGEFTQFASNAVDDPSFNDVVTLLNANGTNGATNNTFLDSSANNLAVSRNGTPVQGSFGPFSKSSGAWSTYHPVRSSFYSNSMFVNGTQTTGNIGTNFTLELWFRGSSSSANNTLVGKTNLSTNADDSWYCYTGTGTGTFCFGVYYGATATRSFKAFSSTTRIDDNKWHHCAFVKEGTTYRIFVDGVLESSEVFATALSQGTMHNVTIGGSTNNPTGGDYGRTDCYISNVRITNTAVYTSGFTPSATPLTAIPGTLLLACQDNRLKDNGPNSYSITVQQGTPTILPFSPFISSETPAVNQIGSVYLNGSTDYLSLPVTSQLDFGTGDFTIECWFYISGNSPLNGGSRIGALFSSYAASSWQSGYRLVLNGSSTTGGSGVAFTVQNNGNAVNSLSSSTPISQKTWNHIAVSRAGANTRMFINGAIVASASNWLSSAVNGTGFTPKIGTTIHTALGNEAFNGYISGLRVVKGTALYTAAFTPSTSPPASVSGTALLANFSNAGIVDNSKSFNLSLVGGAQISTSVSKFGGSSILFNGTNAGTNLGETLDPRLSIGTKDFTIEAWIYPSVTMNMPAIYANYGGARTGAYLLRMNNGKISFYVFPAADILTSSTTLPLNTWTHVAISRSSGTMRLFINGVQEASTSTAYDLISDPARPATIGYYWQSAAIEPNGYFNGYIDDFRITIGKDRYGINSVTRSLSGTTEIISFPVGSTVASILSVVGTGGSDPSARVSITSSSSGTLSSTDPSPNNGVTTSGGSAPSSLSITTNANAINIILPNSGITNSSLKSSLEANAGVSALVSISNPVGNASAFAQTNLSGGNDAVAANIAVSVSGNSVTVSVPENTPATALVSAVNQSSEASVIVTASSANADSADTSGSVNLAGGIG